MIHGLAVVDSNGRIIRETVARDSITAKLGFMRTNPQYCERGWEAAEKDGYAVKRVRISVVPPTPTVQTEYKPDMDVWYHPGLTSLEKSRARDYLMRCGSCDLVWSTYMGEYVRGIIGSCPTCDPYP